MGTYVFVFRLAAPSSPLPKLLPRNNSDGGREGGRGDLNLLLFPFPSTDSFCSLCISLSQKNSFLCVYVYLSVCPSLCAASCRADEAHLLLLCKSHEGKNTSFLHEEGAQRKRWKRARARKRMKTNKPENVGPSKGRKAEGRQDGGKAKVGLRKREKLNRAADGQRAEEKT